MKTLRLHNLTIGIASAFEREHVNCYGARHRLADVRAKGVDEVYSGGRGGLLSVSLHPEGTMG